MTGLFANSDQDLPTSFSSTRPLRCVVISRPFRAVSVHPIDEVLRIRDIEWLLLVPVAQVDSTLSQLPSRTCPSALHTFRAHPYGRPQEDAC